MTQHFKKCKLPYEEMEERLTHTKSRTKRKNIRKHFPFIVCTKLSSKTNITKMVYLKVISILV